MAGGEDVVGRMHAALAHVRAQHPGASREGRVGRYRDLCRAGAAALPVRGASLTLGAAEGSSTLLAASDTIAEQVADLSLTTGDGPATYAAISGTPVLDHDLDATRWPLFAPTARQLGARALFAFPMQLGAIRIGVLALDHDRSHPLDAAQLAAAHVLVRGCVAAVLSDLDHQDEAATSRRDRERRSPVDDWLSHPDGMHDHVHLATGMVLAQLGTTAEVALLRLRAHAFATDRPLGDVAADVVARRLSFREEPGDPL